MLSSVVAAGNESQWLSDVSVSQAGANDVVVCGDTSKHVSPVR